MLYDERFEAKYGYWRPIIERSVMAYRRCGDLHEGFARARCYGWYSSNSRVMRHKSAEGQAAEQVGASSGSESSEATVPSRCSQTWAILVKPVYEIDPLACPRCGGQAKGVAFLQPAQGAVIEKIHVIYASDHVAMENDRRKKREMLEALTKPGFGFVYPLNEQTCYRL